MHGMEVHRSHPAIVGIFPVPEDLMVCVGQLYHTLNGRKLGTLEDLLCSPNPTFAFKMGGPNAGIFGTPTQTHQSPQRGLASSFGHNVKNPEAC